MDDGGPGKSAERDKLDAMISMGTWDVFLYLERFDWEVWQSYALQRAFVMNCCKWLIEGKAHGCPGN